MDDSDQDFAEVGKRLLKRFPKKPGPSRQPKKAEQQQSSSQTNHAEKKRKKKTDKGGGSSGTQRPVVSVGTGHDAGDAGSSVGQRPESGGLTAKDKVLHRMQQFKRASPHKIPNVDKSQKTKDKSHSVPAPPPALVPRRDDPQSLSSGVQSDPELSDEALALLLQQELDEEVAEVRRVNLEDRGLFFCQICQKDLSHMSPSGRTQHLNRCLDESEESGPAPPPPPPPSSVPDCPICGKKFKSQKSRSAHLKRCSTDMGVPPGVLLQAVQRQAAEAPSIPPANTLTDTGGTKRKGSTRPGLATRKKPRKKTEALDEDTMVALALSSSLLELERETEADLLAETAGAHSSTAAVLKWRPDTGKGRGKRRKGGVPRPPPLLLVQDAEAAQARLQERVSALLLRSRTPSPPTTPTLRPSALSGCTGAAPLWHKSALLSADCSSQCDFYTPELREFITPWQPADAASTSAVSKPETPLQPGSKAAPVSAPAASILPPGSPTTAASSQTEQALVSSQALRDLLELAEEGMTLSQYADLAPGPGRVSACLHLSGFMPEEAEEQDDPGVSGFLPHTGSDHARSRARTDRTGAEAERSSRTTLALCGLASDLASMVNNPQLSDVQLQVDSGEVYFAHSFMVYARCPLLAEMVHESGFGVQEEGLPAAQRVLMSDVPGQAVFALLQYLYTARCSIPAPLQPHVLELASRFDLQELQRLCEDGCQEDKAVDGPTDQAFAELLRSMWNEGGGEHEGADTDRGSGEEPGSEEDGQADELAAGDREVCEEKVNEDELEEIYEFAATQRQKQEEEEEEEEEEGESDEQEEKIEDEVLTKPAEPQRSSTDLGTKPQLNPSQDYSCLFSDTWGVYEHDPSPSTSTSTPGQPQTHTTQKPHSASPQLSSRALLQSSGSVLSCSPSPPPSTSTLPVPGQSPGQEGAAAELDLPDRGGSPEPDSPASHTVPAPPERREPELIVLSDSSEDMEVGHGSLSPPPPPPQDRHSYTSIKSVPETPVEKTQSQSIKLSPDLSSPVQTHSGCNENLEDYSPEVSWLIPSTPLPQECSTRTSSTQTRSSMCRTRLFPNGGSSSAASPLPSPAASRPETAEGSVSRLKGDGSASCSSSSDLCLRGSSSDAGGLRDAVFTAPWSHPRSLGSPSSKRDTPLHQKPKPYSSTPLHAELQLPRVLSHSSLERPSLRSPGREPTPPESPEKMELGSFHLSPLSKSSNPASSSSLGGLHRSQRHSDASSQSRVSEAEQGGSEGGSGGPSEDGADGGEREEDISGGGFQQSFMDMDEPPMAFNDSWGLDACADPVPGCFSLRLSTGSSQEEQSLEQPAAAAPAPPAPSPPPPPPDRNTPELNNSLLRAWDSWGEEEEEEEEEEVLPLSQRLNPSTKHKTPKPSRSRRRHTLVPITPMPHYSDMDTPDLKNKLNRFGVRPLPKRQMILKLKEIHQYTHQLVSSDSEDEAPPRAKPPPGCSTAGSGPGSCAQRATFKEPRAPADGLGPTHSTEEEAEPLSASQGSNTSSTAASEESERSNPELCLSSGGDEDSDEGVTASQVASRLQDRLDAVRSFILSDGELYSQILQYRPLVLSHFQERLKAAGIRLGVAKLADYLDSQCISFTTAKPGQAPSRRRGHKTSRGAKDGAAGRKRAVKTMY